MPRGKRSKSSAPRSSSRSRIRRLRADDATCSATAALRIDPWRATASADRKNRGGDGGRGGCVFGRGSDPLSCGELFVRTDRGISGLLRSSVYRRAGALGVAFAPTPLVSENRTAPVARNRTLRALMDGRGALP